jgi:hypothetical protein
LGATKLFRPGATWGEKLLVAGMLALLPVYFLILIPLVVVAAPFYLAYGLLLRLVLEIRWGRLGKRILLVYSRSPTWREHVETNWIPRLRDHAVVLNWSDRATWSRRNSFAVWIFRHWAPSHDFNPMAIVFPPFRRAQHIGFFYAFRDAKHGNLTKLQEAESKLFSLANDVGPPEPGG